MFSVKGHIVNILGIAGHTVSVTTTQRCSHSLKEARNNIYMAVHCCIPPKLYLGH